MNANIDFTTRFQFVSLLIICKYVNTLIITGSQPVLQDTGEAFANTLVAIQLISNLPDVLSA